MEPTIKQKIKRLIMAAKMAKKELFYAPCRDNSDHTLCLKCYTEGILTQAIKDMEGVK